MVVDYDVSFPLLHLALYSIVMSISAIVSHVQYTLFLVNIVS